MVIEEDCFVGLGTPRIILSMKRMTIKRKIVKPKKRWYQEFLSTSSIDIFPSLSAKKSFDIEPPVAI